MANTQQDKELMKLLQGAVGAGAKSAFPWSSLVSGLFSLGSSALGYAQNQQNIKAQKEANQQNLALTREANAAQVRESEKAYQRSLPTQQVANFRAAGMSHAGALQALSGGGAYSPAPVNTGQVEPVQGSSAGVQQGLESMVQAIMQQQSNATQMKIAKEQHDAMVESARLSAEASKYSADAHERASRYGADIGFKGTAYSSDKDLEGRDLTSSRQLQGVLAQVGLGEKQLAEVIRQYDDMSEYNKRKFNAEIQHLNAQTSLDNARKKEIIDKLAEWNSSTEKNARSAISLAQTYLGYKSYYDTELMLQKFIKHTGAEVYWHTSESGALVPNIRYSRDFVNKREFWESDVGQFWSDANRTINSELLAEILSCVILKR